MLHALNQSEQTLSVVQKELQDDYGLETEEVEKTVNKSHFKKLIRKYFKG